MRLQTSLFSAIGLLLLSGCTKTDDTRLPRTRPLTSRVFERTPERIARGKYLSEGVCQCLVCHSERDWSKPGAPPIPEKLGAGSVLIEDSVHRIPAPNLTPDVETGAGTWTDDMLARAIREGIGHDGRALSGPMWYWSFANLSDEDLASIIVYLRTLPPVYNKLPPRLLTPKGEESAKDGPKPITEPVPARNMSTMVERGRYLADIADCSGCHSAWEAPFVPGVFGGGNLIEEKGKRLDHNLFSANLTSDPSGIAYYGDSLFIEVIRTGRVRVRELDAVMPWVAFRNMNNDDLRSIFAYLQSVPRVRHVVDNHMQPTHCPMCGQEHGEGNQNVTKFETFEHLSLDSLFLKQCEGTYEGEFFTVTVKREHGRLVAEAGGNKMEMAADKDTLFYAKEAPGPIRFMRDSNGRVTHLVSYEDKEYPAKRVN